MKTICSSLSLDFVLLKDQKIGVLLPSMGQTICLVLGLMLAKKVPVMMNWTLGSKHLQDVARIAELSTIITSYEFIETLPFKLGAELEEKFLFIEEMKDQLSFRKRLAAIRLGRHSRSYFKKRFGLSSLSKNDPAIIFFTSGSEKDPKGVPLSHENLLVNEKEAFDRLGVNASDVFLGLVPSFHVYGFSLTLLAPLLKGLRIVIAPNPLDLSGHWK
jgi:long-chain-fatty-acid--[acyl-carrier-protein] ligase